MPRTNKYGNMPPAPAHTAKVKGDADTYKVWGIDWLNHRVLLDRAGLESQLLALRADKLGEVMPRLSDAILNIPCVDCSPP